jgi:ATP-dependent Clp protease protease subunit
MEIFTPINRINEEIKLQRIKDRILFIEDEIDRESIFTVREIMRRIVAIDEVHNTPKEDRKITLNISSYGGECFAGLSLISYMEYLQEELGYTIETVVNGMAMSMGAMIFLAGSKGHRICTRYCTVMIHQILNGLCGYYKFQDQKENLEESRKLWENLKEIIIKNTKITNEMLEDITTRKYDWHMNPLECIEYGVADKIM